MPLRGESVGTAYVRLIADGSGIPDDIRDAFKNADGAYEDAGDRGAKVYKAAAAKELKNHNDKTIDTALNQAFARDDFVREFFNDDNGPWAKFERNLRARAGDAGDEASAQLIEKFTRQGSLDGLENEIKRVMARINHNLIEGVHEQEQALAKEQKDMDDFERKFRATMEESDRVYINSKKVSTEALEAIRRKYEDLGIVIPQLRKEMVNLGNDVDVTAHKVDRDRNVFQRLGFAMEDMARKIKFGKGSRSELLNFIGSFIVAGNVMVAQIPKMIGNIGGMFTAFLDAREEGGKFWKSITDGILGADGKPGAQSAIGGLIKGGLPGLVVGFGAVAVAVGGLVAVLGPVVSIISGITAAIIALTSSIAFGLVGALAPLAGLIAPIGIGIAVVVAGLVGMDKQAKKTLKEAVLPLVDGFKELGEFAREGFFAKFDIDSQGLASTIRGLGPLFQATGAAIGDASSQLINGFKSDNFDHFVDAMVTFVPQAIRSLATSFQNLAGAVGNIFVDLIPSTQNFLGWLERITQEFQDFTIDHPDKIIGFFEDAAESAKGLGDFLGSIVNLLSVLLSSGRETGDKIFGSLTDNINEFADSLKPTGGKTIFDEQTGGIKRVKGSLDGLPRKDPLAGFFANGQQVAEDLGDIAVALGQIADALDNENNRKIAGFMLDATVKAIDFGNAIVGFYDSVFGKIGETIALFREQSSRDIGFVQDMGTKIQEFAGKIHAFFDAVGSFGRGFNPFSKIAEGFQALKDTFAGGGSGLNAHAIQAQFTSWIPGAAGKIQDFAGHIRTIMGNAKDNIINRFQSIGGPIASAFNALLGPVRNAAGNIRGAMSNAADAVVRFIQSIPSRLGGIANQFGNAARDWKSEVLSVVSDIPGEIVDFFSGLAGRIISAIGDINIPIHFSAPNITLPGGKQFNPTDLIPHGAAGMVTNGPTLAGEAGREAIVPLDRPLSQIDPAVRWLAAIAQGITAPSGSPTAVTPDKVVNVTQNITTPTADPRAAATEFVNQLVATGY